MSIKLTPHYLNSYETAYNIFSRDPSLIIGNIDGNRANLFSNQRWEQAAKEGSLDMYISALYNFNQEVKDKDKFITDYNFNFADDRTAMDAMYNELFADKENVDEERELYVTDEYGNQKLEKFKASDYEFYKRIIKETNDRRYEEFLVQQDEARKKALEGTAQRFWSDVGALGSEFIYGITNSIDSLLNSLAAINSGLDAMFHGKDPIDAMVQTNAQGTMRIFEQLGVQQALLDFERKFTGMRNLDGSYSDWGQYVGGVLSTVGQMVPAALTGKFAGKLATANGIGTMGSMTASQAASSVVFYQGMTADNIRETYRQFAAKGVSAPNAQILSNALVKSTMQWLVEVGLGKVLGGTSLDNMVFGRAVSVGASKSLTKAGIKRIAKDFVQEGLEEVLQDTSDFLVNGIFTVANENFGDLTDLNWQTITDAFVIGGLASFAGNARNIIKDYTVASLNKKQDDLLNVKQPVIDKEGNVKYDKAGNIKTKKLNPIANWEYGLDMQSFMTNFAKLNQQTTMFAISKWGDKQVQKRYSDAFTEMYAAYRMITSIQESIGEERFTAADNLLKEVTRLTNEGKFTKSAAVDSSNNLYQLLVLNKLNMDNNLATLKKANITKVEAVVQKDDVGKDSNKLSNLFNKVRKIGKKKNITASGDTDEHIEQECEKILAENKKINTIVGTDGDKIVVMKDVLFVPIKYMRKADATIIYETIAEQTLVREIVNTKDVKLPIKLVLDTFKDVSGTKDATEEEAIFNLIFNDSFFRTMLSVANKDMYNFLYSLTLMEKRVVTDNLRTAIYKKKIDTVLKNMKYDLTIYLQNQMFAIPDARIFTPEEIKKIQDVRYSKNLIGRVLDSEEFKRLSLNDWTILHNRVKGLQLDSKEKETIWNNLHSDKVSIRESALNSIVIHYYELYNNSYDGKTYMPDNSMANRSFNMYLQTYNRTIKDINQENLDIISSEFQRFSNNKYSVDINEFNKLVITDTSGHQAGYSDYSLQADFVKNGQKIENRTTIDRALAENRDIVELLNPKLDEVAKAYYSIDDVINNPSLLRSDIQENIRREAAHNIIDTEATLQYLRTYFINKYKTTTITVTDDGHYAFANVRPMLNSLKTDKITLTKNVTSISQIIKPEYLYGRLTDLSVILTDEDINAVYDSKRNVIKVNRKVAKSGNDYLRFVIMHEFQHAIQIENHMNLGIDADWIHSKSITSTIRKNIIRDIKKHRPELFEGIKDNTREEELVANDFVYFSSGESTAMGIDASTLLDFYPTIVSKNVSGGTSITLPWGTKFNISSDLPMSIKLRNADNQTYNLLDPYKYNDFMVHRRNNKYNSELTDRNYTEYMNLHEEISSLLHVKEYENMNKFDYDSALDSKFVKRSIASVLSPAVKDKMIRMMYHQVNMDVTMEEFYRMDIPFVRIQRSAENLEHEPFYSAYIANNVNAPLQTIAKSLQKVPALDTVTVVVGTFKPDNIVGFLGDNYEVLLPTDAINTAKKYTVKLKDYVPTGGPDVVNQILVAASSFENLRDDDSRVDGIEILSIDMPDLEYNYVGYDIADDVVDGFDAVRELITKFKYNTNYYDIEKDAKLLRKITPSVKSAMLQQYYNNYNFKELGITFEEFVNSKIPAISISHVAQPPSDNAYKTYIAVSKNMDYELISELMYGSDSNNMYINSAYIPVRDILAAGSNVIIANADYETIDLIAPVVTKTTDGFNFSDVYIFDDNVYPYDKMYISELRKYYYENIPERDKNNKTLMQFANKVFDLCEKLNIKTRLKNIQSEGKMLAGYFNPHTYTVTLDETLIASDFNSYYRDIKSDRLDIDDYYKEYGATTILHELIHAVTSYAINLYSHYNYSETNIARRNRINELAQKEGLDANLLEKVFKYVEFLNKMYNQVLNTDWYDRQDEDRASEYLETNLKEFVSVIMSETSIQDKLKEYKVWDELVEEFSELVGINVSSKDTDIFNVTSAVVNKLLEVDPKMINVYTKYIGTGSIVGREFPTTISITVKTENEKKLLKNVQSSAKQYHEANPSWNAEKIAEKLKTSKGFDFVPDEYINEISNAVSNEQRLTISVTDTKLSKTEKRKSTKKKEITMKDVKKASEEVREHSSKDTNALEELLKFNTEQKDNVLQYTKELEEEEKRYVSQRKYKDTNLGKYGYVGKYKITQMMPALRDFIIDADKDIDEKLWDKLTKGELTYSYVMDFLRDADDIDNKTFALINKHFFHNDYIKTFSELQNFVKQKTSEFYALGSIAKELKMQYVLDTEVTSDFIEQLKMYITGSPTYQKKYEQIRDRYYTYKGGDIVVSEKNLRRLWMEYYNGTLRTAQSLAGIAKYVAARNWLVTGDAGTKARTNLDVVGSIVADEHAEDAFDDIFYSQDRREKLSKLNMITSALLKFQAEDHGVTNVDAILKIQRTYASKYENLSDKQLDAAYKHLETKLTTQYMNKLIRNSIIIEALGLNVEKLDKNTYEKIDKIGEELAPNLVKPPRTVYRNIKGVINRMKYNLSPKAKKILVEQRKDLFNDDLTLKKERYMETVNGKDVYKSVDELEKLLDEVKELSRQVRQGVYDNATNSKYTKKLQEEMAKLRNKLDKTKLELVKGKKSKVIVYKVEDVKFAIDTDVPMPAALQELLNTSFTKTAASKTKYLTDPDQKHVKANLRSFLQDNAVFLETMSQQDAEEIVNFYLNSELLPGTNKVRQYIATQEYLLVYILKSAKVGRFVFDEATIKQIVNRQETLSSIFAEGLSVWRSAMKMLDPEKEILQSLGRASDVEFDVEDIEHLARAVETGDLNTINNAKIAMYNNTLENYKGDKRSVLDKLLKFEAFAMLSGPGTWVRNWTSNILVTAGNKGSEKTGKAVTKLINNLFPNKKWKYDKQYKIIGTVVGNDVKTFIQREIVNSGVLELLKDGLTKYDTRRSAHLSYTANETITEMIAQAVKVRIFQETTFDSQLMKKAQAFVLKMLSDDPFVNKAAIRYLGKILVEDKVDITHGLTKNVLNCLADAYTMAANDYMHKPNFFNKMEHQMKHDWGEGAFFMYKQIFPFAAASWNWFLEGIKYTPIGLAKSIINYAKLESTIEKMDKRRQSGESTVSSRFAEYLTTRDIGKGVIGSIGFMIGALLAGFGYAGIDEEDDKYKLFIKVGSEKITVDISDVFGTQGIMLGITIISSGINVRKAVEQGEKTDVSRYLWSAIGDTLDTMFLDSNFSELFNSFRYSDSFGEWIAQQPYSMLNIMIPNFIKTLTSITYGHKIKYSSGILGKIERLAVSTIPGLAYAMPSYIDPYTGEKQIPYKLWYVTKLFNKLSTVKVHPYNVSEAEKEAISLGIRKNILTGRYTVNGKEYTLDSKQNEDANIMYGKLNKVQLDTLLGNKKTYEVYDEKKKKYVTKRYAEMTDKQKKTVINRIMANNSQIAKVYVLNKSGKYKYYATESEYKKLKSLKVPNVFKKTDKYSGFAEI